MIIRRVVPGILSALTPTLVFAISYAAQIKTTAPRLSRRSRHVLIRAGIYSTGMVLSAVTRDSRDFMF